MESRKAHFTVGQIIHHRLFGYRGVVVDADDRFQGTDDWYSSVALSRPPKDRPWYHVLVHGSSMRTYVAERNLEPTPDTRPVENPYLGEYFETWQDGAYVLRGKLN